MPVGVKRADVEQALSNGPILIYEQSVGGEARFVYYGETDAGRLLAVVLTERDDRIRVVTAYRLDAGQKRDSFARRLRVNHEEDDPTTGVCKRRR